jgi:hypothetical protein
MPSDWASPIIGGPVINQNRQATFQQVKADFDFVEQEL